MMKMKILAAVASCLVGLGGAASAATITNTDGAFSPFGGFDWAQDGFAFTSGFLPVSGDVFNLTYAANAVSITQEGGGTFITGRLDTNANGAFAAVLAPAYEYTVVANLTEQVNTCSAETTNGAPNSCTFNLLGGTFNIYYDPQTGTSAAANRLNGTGYTDGILLISGAFNQQSAGSYTQGTVSSVSLEGVVNFTNNTYINPNLLGTTVTSTLQLGSSITSFTAPTGFNGTALPPGTLVFQADANQDFQAAVIPEPSVLLLAGLGMVGVAASRRRR